MVYIHQDSTIETGVLHLVMNELSRAADSAAWHDALGRYGYALRRTGAGTLITTLPHDVEICRLPSSLRFDAPA
jgi:hypothetical protein